MNGFHRKVVERKKDRKDQTKKKNIYIHTDTRDDLSNAKPEMGFNCENLQERPGTAALAAASSPLPLCLALLLVIVVEVVL